jgi:hypothetical protein
MVDRDSERLEEEIAGVERPERDVGLSGEYLLQALDGLHNAGDPAHLYAHWRRFPPPDPEKVEADMRAAARRARIRAARTAVLFAALAAESYVNEFLSVHGALAKWDRRVDPSEVPRGHTRGIRLTAVLRRPRSISGDC